MSNESLQKDTGEIVAITDVKASFTWKIHDFFSLNPHVYHRFESPVFKFLDALWCLEVNPNGETRYNTVGWVGLYLKKVYSVTSKHTVTWEMEMLSNLPSRSKAIELKHDFLGNETSWGTSKMVERHSLYSLSPGGNVTFSFKIRGTSNENIHATSPSGHLKGNNLKKLDNLLMLSHNFKDLFLSQRRSDVFLKVRGREFPAHKVILEARSSVFAKMFEHDMLENRNGIVDIPDFEPDIFHHVLCYIYSGEIEGFSPENICEVYKAADKYDLGELKEKCAEYMETNMTVENVCDVLLLSDMHQETKLKDLVQDFIVQNKQEVLASESWKLIVSENKSLAYHTLESIMFHYTLKSD